MHAISAPLLIFPGLARSPRRFRAGLSRYLKKLTSGLGTTGDLQRPTTPRRAARRRRCWSRSCCRVGLLAGDPARRIRGNVCVGDATRNGGRDEPGLACDRHSRCVRVGRLRIGTVRRKRRRRSRRQRRIKQRRRRTGSRWNRWGRGHEQRWRHWRRARWNGRGERGTRWHQRDRNGRNVWRTDLHSPRDLLRAGGMSAVHEHPVDSLSDNVWRHRRWIGRTRRYGRSGRRGWRWRIDRISRPRRIDRIRGARWNGRWLGRPWRDGRRLGRHRRSQVLSGRRRLPGIQML